MLIEHKCQYCDGSGIRIIESSALLGILKKSLPTTCEYCNGRGSMVDVPVCDFCEGQGLVGNERETCRTCNGTGKADEFSFIPRAYLKPGTLFHRRCDMCSEGNFEVVSEIEEHKLVRSWEADEELRHVEMIERVWVRCTHCKNRYAILIGDKLHRELDPQTISTLEDLGLNLRFLHHA